MNTSYFAFWDGQGWQRRWMIESFIIKEPVVFESEWAFMICQSPIFGYEAEVYLCIWDMVHKTISESLREAGLLK